LNPDGQPSQWVWTPRRIGVHFGLVQPGVEDLAKVDRTRRVRRMVRLAAAEKRGSGWRAERARKRLDRLALVADEKTVTDAGAQLRRALSIRSTLFGTPTQPATDPAPVSRPARVPTVDLDRVWTHIVSGHHAPVESTREPAPVAVNGHHVPPLESTQKPTQKRPVPTRKPRPSRFTGRDRGAALADEYERLSRLNGRPPSDQQLADAAGVSKATANRWKTQRADSQPPTE
jgi:hypothetical protein